MSLPDVGLLLVSHSSSYLAQPSPSHLLFRECSALGQLFHIFITKKDYYFFPSLFFFKGFFTADPLFFVFVFVFVFHPKLASYFSHRNWRKKKIELPLMWFISTIGQDTLSCRRRVSQSCQRMSNTLSLLLIFGIEIGRREWLFGCSQVGGGGVWVGGVVSLF